MVSIHTNLSVSSGIKFSSFYSANKAINEKNIAKFSINDKIFQFRFQIKTDIKQNLSDQNAIFHFNQLNKEDKVSLFYKDTPISELSPDEANHLISADGHFGVDKTSQRIIDFVIKGAGDNIDQLRAGREGVLRGFAEAEKAWGGKLPNISYQTLSKSLDVIDKKIRDIGETVVDIST